MQKVIDEMEVRYCKILNKYYPAHGSNGFTERNLTVNFCAAFEKVSGDDIVVWYEAPVGKGKSHIDAFVIDSNKQELLLIEAKRLTNTDKKIVSVSKDIERITSDSNSKFLSHENLLKIDVKAYKVYGIILVDIWTTKAISKSGSGFDKKQKLLDSFANKTFHKEHQEMDNLGVVGYYLSKKIDAGNEYYYTLLAMKIENETNQRLV
jgi:hypothetical protein